MSPREGEEGKAPADTSLIMSKPTVSINELADELQKHNNSDELKSLIEMLRSRQIDLKEFCRRVRIIMGESVLKDTVEGLQRSKRATVQGGTSSGAPPTGE